MPRPVLRQVAKGLAGDRGVFDTQNLRARNLGGAIDHELGRGECFWFACGGAFEAQLVPAGSKVVVLGAPAGASGVKIITSKATTSVSTTKAAPITTTGASAPPP